MSTAERVLKRQDVKSEHTWDLTSVFETPEAWEAERQAVAEQEVVSRPNPEHDEGMAIETISNATEARQTPILPNRQRVDVTSPTLIEVA